MDLFFDSAKQSNSVAKKTVQKVTVEEALKQVFCISSILAVLDLYVKDKVLARIEVDARGAGVYKFRTIAGANIVAESVYKIARARLEGGSDFEGPPAIPLDCYVPSSDKIQVVVDVISSLETGTSDDV